MWNTIKYKEGDLVKNECIYIKDVDRINKKRRCLFKCRCGNEFEAQLNNIRQGMISSCGCYATKCRKERITHGMRNTTEYRIYTGIKDRTCNPKSKYWNRYGGSGIGISDDWKESFENFYRDMGNRPHGDMSIDRIDNSKGYSKENCRWADRKTQCSNKNNNIRLEYNGENLTVTQWSERLNLTPQALFRRIGYGWTIEQIVTTPNANKDRNLRPNRY